MYKIIDWNEAEVLYPGCSAEWDVFLQEQKYLTDDNEYVIKHRDEIFQIFVEYRKCLQGVECRCAVYHTNWRRSSITIPTERIQL